MVRFTSKMAGFTALAAAFSMAASPVAAAQLSIPMAKSPAGVSAASAQDESAYHGRWGRHRDRGIDAGDVLAGVLIIGGIAAIASAASKSSRDRETRDVRYREPYPQDNRYDDRQPSRYNGDGINNAVNMCVDQVERGPDRVAEVDNASRSGDGWHVSGSLEQGDGFTCWIDNDGRIRSVDFVGGDFSYSDAPAAQGQYGGQYDDDYYARARADLDAAGGVDSDLAQGAG